MSNVTSQPLPPLTVSQLTNAIKLSIESTFPSIYLQGEISNFRLQTSGHLYFSLKDAHAQIAAVMFRSDASLLSVKPKGGDQVTVKGSLNVYAPKGNYQLIVYELAYVGLGELLQKLELLKVKLHQRGWFKSTHKKRLPRFPTRIGVVTSPTGAVIQDIINVLKRRFSGFHLILNPVKVQGEGAAEEIAEAIAQFNRYALVDVIIVGRGGGSLEDLWAFNEEIVAAAIFQSRIPIISAVGHETDHCIADYVADVRAPTPSAAAEIVIAEKAQQLEHLSVLRQRMQQTVNHLIQQSRYRLKAILKHPLLSRPLTLVEWRMQKLDDYRDDLDEAMQHLIQSKKHELALRSTEALSLKPTQQISHFRQRLLTYERSLQQQVLQRLAQDHRKLAHLIDLLKALDPKGILKKGYSILFAEKSSSVIHSVRHLTKGQQATLLLSDGELLITIKEVILCEHPSFPNTGIYSSQL